MNKYHKAESRRVKRIVGTAKYCGRRINYRTVRRGLREYERSLNAAPKILSKGLKRMAYAVKEGARTINNKEDRLTC